MSSVNGDPMQPCIVYTLIPTNHTGFVMRTAIDWPDLAMEHATWVTAIGTLALALATFVYVRQTSRVTRAAETSASAAEAAAQHAARTAALAERALLVEVMPLLVADFQAPIHFRVRNVGRSTAFNGTVAMHDREEAFPPIHAGEQNDGGHITLAQTDDDSVRVGHIVIEYEDAIGNRYKTEADLDRPDGREYETYLWRVGGWQRLRAQSGE